jgi:hypothetical protein
MPYTLEHGAGGKAIVYNVLKVDAGWRIEAYVPRGVSTRDRKKVLHWFDSYRTQVRQQNPSWIVAFRATPPNAYFLDIWPVDEGSEATKAEAQVRHLSNLWQQMTFDYV